jgi:hypothetical protein
MDMWATIQFGPPIWEVWAEYPLKRVCILLLAGTASASLCHAWFQILALRRLTQAYVGSIELPGSEAADV